MKSELFNCYHRFTQTHLGLRILEKSDINYPHEMRFFSQINELQIQGDTLSYSWYDLTKKIFRECQDDEVKAKLFRIITRAYHVASERKMKEILEELQFLLEEVFFSENYNEKMFEDAWVTLTSEWCDEEKMYNFLEKINHQVAIVNDKMVQEKLIEKIGAYATQSIGVIHGIKNFGKVTKMDELILKKLRSAFVDHKDVVFNDEEKARIQEVITK